jgi:hypothetical protein
MQQLMQQTLFVLPDAAFAAARYNTDCDAAAMKANMEM